MALALVCSRDNNQRASIDAGDRMSQLSRRYHGTCSLTQQPETMEAG
jgi:hypothetical protein